MLTLKTHAIRPGVGRVEVASYVRIKADGQPPIILQGGKAYYEDGKEIKDLGPFEGEISKLSEGGLEAAGWNGRKLKAKRPLTEEQRIVGIGEIE